MNTKEMMNIINNIKNNGHDLNNLTEDMLKHAIMSYKNKNPKISTKMDWLVNSLLNGKDKRTNLVKKINKSMNLQNFGIIRAPTGIGKSGIIYTDIFNRITKNNGEKKQIFIISTPLLCLNDQFFNDMISTLYGANIISNKNCVIANNSSDIELKKGTFELTQKNGKKFDTEIEMMCVEDACLELKKPNTKIALIVSTHKSFNNMLNPLKNIKNKFGEKIEIGAYMDEEHTIKFNGNSNVVSTEEIDEEITDGVVDINSFKNVFNFFYVTSATPRESHGELLKNIFNLTNPYVADIGAQDAINSKDILRVRATTCTVNDKKNFAEIEEIVRHIVKNNNKVNDETHVPFVKNLINCETTDDLIQLCDYLVNKGHKVFYTTAKTGKHFKDKNGDVEYTSISDFSNAINDIQSDVVVLHIRQVIAGVDISGLTHCIIRNVHNYVADSVRMIQTIGRTLRYYQNERVEIQKNPNFKLKKNFGNVYFVINNDAELEENFRYIEKFLYVTYNTTMVNCYDLIDHKITGNHKLVRLNTDNFTKMQKTTSVNVAYIDYFLNDDFIKTLIEQRADDYDILEAIKNINENFKTNYENDPCYSTEYLAVIKGYDNKLNEVMEAIKNMMNK